MVAMPEFVYEDGGTTRRVALRGGMTIGRSSDNDVVLRDFSVSRRHAVVEETDGRLQVRDLDSTNGVKVNDTFVTTGNIAAGDVVTIGNFELEVRDALVESSGLSSATYLRPLTEFNDDYGLEGEPSAPQPSIETSERGRVFEILAQVAKTLLQAGELEPVLEKVMDVIFEFLIVDRGFIVLFDDSGEPRLELFRTREMEADSRPEVPISRTILDMVVGQKVAVLTHDAQADERFEAGQSIRIHHIRSAMCAPLWHREKVIGVIYVDSPLHVGSFSAGDLDLLTALANYAAVAIERARLNERIRAEQAARDRLVRYHSPAVIEAVLARPERGEPAVTLREVSILFVDIVGFTPLCESSAPEEVADFLSQFFSLAADAVFEYGGTLDKFIGDAVMAFWGAPLPQDDHAERAVRSAQLMMRDLRRWNEVRVGEGQEPVSVRVAVHSGPVVVGDIGSETRVDYTVLGNTVNVAARLEEFVAQPDQVIIGETTQAAIANLIPTERLDDVHLKGLSRTIAVYRLAEEALAAPGGDG
jgi:adenylate cyclase